MRLNVFFFNPHNQTTWTIWFQPQQRFIFPPVLNVLLKNYFTTFTNLQPLLLYIVWISVNLFHYKWKNSFSTSPAFQWKPGKCGTTTFHFFALATFFMRKKEITMLECPVWCHKMFATPPARSLFWLLKSAQCPETMSQNTNIQFPHTYFDN